MKSNNLLEGPSLTNHEALQAELVWLGEDYLDYIVSTLGHGLQRQNPEIKLTSVRFLAPPTIQVTGRTGNGMVCDAEAAFYLSVAAENEHGKTIKMKALLQAVGENLDSPGAAWIQSNMEIETLEV